MNTVLITGCSSGIGKECALILNREGFRVFAGVRNEADGTSLKNESSGRIMPVILDITDEKNVKQAAERLGEELGHDGLDALVNNAGITVQGPMEFIPLALFEKQLRVNVTGHLLVTQAFLPLIRKAKGRIVFISSMSGRFTMPLLGAYSASKFALEAVANAFRIELLSTGIRVCLVEPGDVKSKIYDKAITAISAMIEGLPEQAKQYYGKELNMLPKLIEQMEKNAFPTETVAKTVFKALAAKRPKIRYVVGADAKILVLFYRLVPTRIADFITDKAMGILKRSL